MRVLKNIFMKKLLEYILKNIVSKPKLIRVTEDRNNPDLLNITASDDDKGLIIGKSGRIIIALRNLSKIKGAITNRKFYLKVADNSIS